MATDAFLAVLLSALLHATWNAMVKQQADPRGALAASVIGAALPALLVLGATGLPGIEVLPWLAAAASVNIGSMTTMARAYAAADFAVVYPLMRGLVPLILALVTPVLFGERLAPLRLAGIATVSIGIAALAWVSMRRTARLDLVAFAFAVPAALLTAAYVLIDAHAARLGNAPIAYAAAASVVNGAAMVMFDRMRARPVLANLQRHARIAVVSGTLSVASYLLFVWALARAPVALAATLRESSILFAVVIAVLVLNERIGPTRLGAIGLVLLGVVLIRI
jgi:drug/metabolite transporter (DMT)-like permease